MKKTNLTLVGFLLFLSSLFGQELPKEIGFKLPDAVAHKTEEEDGRTLQCFRLQEHTSDPDYWGMDLPSLVLFPLSKEEYEEAVSEFKNKTGNELEEEILSQFPSDPSITDTSVKVGKLAYGKAEGYSAYSTYTVPALETTIRMYSVWFEMNETYWMGSGVSLRGDEDLKTVKAILSSLKPNQSGDDNSE